MVHQVGQFGYQQLFGGQSHGVGGAGQAEYQHAANATGQSPTEHGCWANLLIAERTE